MTDYQLACAISTIIGSYRKGELSKPLDHNHVLKWVSQFDEADRSVILEETLHILTRQYYSREAIENLVDGILCKIREQVGSFESIIFANPQEQGSSQKILYTIISEKLGEEFRGQSADFTEPDKIYVYIDDGLYTGGRARTDLVALIELLPPNSRLYVFYLFAYSNACSYREDQITELAKNKKIEICFDWRRMFYNERSCKAKSIDFVWPTILARKDEEVLAYEAKLKETQKANYLYYNNYVYQKEKGMFSSYDAEERVGYAFLKYGIKICNQLNKSTFRPLGLTTPPSFGFGSLVATDYNICHALRRTVTVLDGTTELVDVTFAGIHQGKETGHGVLADQRFGIGCLFGFGQTGERHTAVRKDIVQASHAAVRIAGGDSDLADVLACKCHFASKVVHDGSQRSTCL